MSFTEALKVAVYRSRLLGGLMAPRCPYKVDPAELAAMVELIDATRASGATIAEVGVAQGDSTVFLLEHMLTTRDPRILLLLDTFRGFTPQSVAHEIGVRGKHRSDYDKFRYGDERRFRRNLKAAGYSHFRTVKGDAACFDWASVAPIGAVLLDVDLYLPTIRTIEAIYPHLLPGGGIVVDDCVQETQWDGSFQAYREFIAAQGVADERLGAKGAIIRKS